MNRIGTGSWSRTWYVVALALIRTTADADQRVAPTTLGMLAADSNVQLDQLREIFRRAGTERTIAVVGSSGNLLYRGNGPAIDSHSLVMRFNEAITKGYEVDVGHDVDSGRYDGVIRTTWEQGYQEAMAKGVIRGDELIIQNIKTTSADPAFSTGGRPTLKLSAGWVKRVHRNQLYHAGTQPSTGFIGLAVATAVANEVGGTVSVYGFGPCHYCGKYFDCVRYYNNSHLPSHPPISWGRVHTPLVPSSYSRTPTRLLTTQRRAAGRKQLVSHGYEGRGDGPRRVSPLQQGG
jgi:hypothetical protein